MRIEHILHTGTARTTGDLTGDARLLRVCPPVMTVRVDPGEPLVAENPAAWVDPLESDAVVDALVAAYRVWLIAQR